MRSTEACRRAGDDPDVMQKRAKSLRRRRSARLREEQSGTGHSSSGHPNLTGWGQRRTHRTFEQPGCKHSLNPGNPGKETRSRCRLESTHLQYRLRVKDQGQLYAVPNPELARGETSRASIIVRTVYTAGGVLHRRDKH